MTTIAPWKDGVDVMKLTDTDLETSRTKSTSVADTSLELHRLVETLRRHWGMEAWSDTVDRGVRIELTHAIDNYDVSFDHSDFDVAYTIPPLGWTDGREYPVVDLVPVDDVDTDSRYVRYSTPPVVWEMIQAAIDDGYVETATEFVERAVVRQLGCQDE